MTVRLLLLLASTVALGACVSASLAATAPPADGTGPSALRTELAFESVLAQAPMRDTARVAAAPGQVLVAGLLNQTMPCFGLTSGAVRTGNRIVVRLTATEVNSTCATFAAGAMDYDVGVAGMAAGAYDVDVVHRVVFKDGRIVETKAGTRRVEVR
jgi:hypothetical protein